jgi:hypothetical protein
LVRPTDGVWSTEHVDGQIRGAYTDVDIHFDMGMSGDLYIEPGQVRLVAWPVGGPDVETIVFDDGTVTARPINALAGAGANPFGGEAGRTPLILVLIGEVLEVLMAGLLLTAGILAVRGSPKTLTFHRGWAWARILIGLGVTAALGWWMWTITEGMGQELGDTAFAGFMQIMTVFGVGFNLLLILAYPIAVLFVIRNERVRDYFEPDRTTY